MDDVNERTSAAHLCVGSLSAAEGGGGCPGVVMVYNRIAQDAHYASHCVEGHAPMGLWVWNDKKAIFRREASQQNAA